MSEKIVDIREASREMEESSPIQHKDLLKRLSEIQPDIATEYIEVISDYVEKILAIRNLIVSLGRPNLSQKLIAAMDQSTLANLKGIIDCLSAQEPISHIQKLIELTFDIVEPTPDQSCKSLKLIDLVKFQKKEDVNLVALAYEFGCLSKRASLLSDVCILVDKDKEEYESVLCTRLSRIAEKELDNMLEIVSAV